MKFKTLSFFPDSLPINEPEAATALPVLAIPKVRPNQQSIPSFFQSAKPNPDSALPKNDRRVATTDTMTLRNSADTYSVVRSFVYGSPDLSAAVNGYLRTAITSDYTAVSKNQDGTFNPQATLALQQLIIRMDILKDYATGFSGISSIRSNSESMGKEILQYGSCACELALDKARLPYRIVPISVTKLKWYPDANSVRPVQVLGGVETDLDIPTFFYVSLDQDLLDPYSSSPMESAIQPVLFAQEFMNDLRRVVKKAIFPRMTVGLDQESIMKNLPPQYFNQPEEITKHINGIIKTMTDQVNSLKPEDALVYLDTMDPKYMDSGNNSLDAEFKVLQNIVDSKVATGAKTLPSILGHGTTANASSAEVLLFMKNAEGTIQAKLNEIYSQVFTLAMRLIGFDVYVDFKYRDIDLRPKSELEAFYSMKQARILEQLSLGFISDEEAAILLTGHMPPPGFTPLAGTGFSAAKANTADNPYSGTSSGADGAGGGNNPAPADNATQKTAPKGAKSKNQGK